jgi:hypothetical protein
MQGERRLADRSADLRRHERDGLRSAVGEKETLGVNHHGVR